MIEFDTQIIPTARAMSFLFFWARSAFKVRKEFYITESSLSGLSLGPVARCRRKWVIDNIDDIRRRFKKDENIESSNDASEC